MPARRWLIVVALFIVTFGISTPLAAYGVFLPVLAETFGWSRGAIATALSMNLLVGGVAGFAIGALADRHGPRLMLVTTVALAGTAFALVGTISSLWQLYLFVSVLGGVGMSSFYLLTAATVTHWFDDRRGLALALALVGFSLGYITAGPIAAWLITRVGWRAAYALAGWRLRRPHPAGRAHRPAAASLGSPAGAREPRRASTARRPPAPTSRCARRSSIRGSGI